MSDTKNAVFKAFLAMIFWMSGVNAQEASGRLKAAREQVEVTCKGVKSDNHIKRLVISTMPRDIESGRYESAKQGADTVLASNPTPAEQQCALSVSKAAQLLQSDAERRFAEKISRQAAREAAAERANDEAEERQAEARRQERARVEQDPNEKLRTIYQNYITMQSCYEARKEFRVQYVTKQELDDARAVTKRDEQSLIKQVPALAKVKDVIWEDAKREYQNTNLALSLGLSGTKHNDFADQLCKLNAIRFTVDPDNRRERIKKDF